MAKSKIIPEFPALMIEDDKKSLVITDLHLGFESKLAIKDSYSSSENVVNSILFLALASGK